MNLITLAQSLSPAPSLQPAAFWAEMDTHMQRLPSGMTLHDSHCRDYHLPNLVLRVQLSGTAAVATWMAESPVLDSRDRLELAQLAQAWLQTIRALGLSSPAVAARVQTASALISAGFASVAVRATGELGSHEHFMPYPATGSGMAMAA